MSTQTLDSSYCFLTHFLTIRSPGTSLQSSVFSTSVNATVCAARLIMAWNESGFYEVLCLDSKSRNRTNLKSWGLLHSQHITFLSDSVLLIQLELRRMSTSPLWTCPCLVEQWTFVKKDLDYVCANLMHVVRRVKCFLQLRQATYWLTLSGGTISFYSSFKLLRFHLSIFNVPLLIINSQFLLFKCAS